MTEMPRGDLEANACNSEPRQSGQCLSFCSSLDKTGCIFESTHIHGHIHEKFGRDGNHFNVAAAGSVVQS